jgi:peroxiredoxin
VRDLTLLEPAEPETLAPGSEAPPFEDLVGVDGMRHGFSTVADRRALVLIFSSNRCPTVHAYRDRLIRLQQEFGPRGVQVIAVNSNDPHLYPDESFGRMVDFARESGYNFPYLADADQRVGRAYGARRTFHVFLLDEGRRVRYEGRFDDSRLPERVTADDLRDALEDVLAGREVRTPRTKPFGCSLDFL